MNRLNPDTYPVWIAYRAACDRYRERFGAVPGGMLLGYETYLKLCQEVSRRCGHGPLETLYPSEVEGLPITIHPTEADLILPLHAGSAERQCDLAIASQQMRR